MARTLTGVTEGKYQFIRPLTEGTSHFCNVRGRRNQRIALLVLCSDSVGFGLPLPTKFLQGLALAHRPGRTSPEIMLSLTHRAQLLLLFLLFPPPIYEYYPERPEIHVMR